jgi:glycosyltransferase involved in cell wall biosynthesis
MERELIDHGIERVSVGWRGGVDVELFSPTRADGMMRARLCGGRQAQTLLLYVGRLSAEKGIESLRDTLDAMPGAALAIVGDGPYRSTLERHFEGRQAYFHGYLHGEDLAAAYASSDVFMFPSRSETLGLVLLEAMASGCPVVAARAGGIPEVVTDGATGLLFDPSDESQPLDHLRRLLADPVLKQRLRLAGHLQAQRWTWKAATAELRGHYLDAIGGGLAAVA